MVKICYWQKNEMEYRFLHRKKYGGSDTTSQTFSWQIIQIHHRLMKREWSEVWSRVRNQNMKTGGLRSSVNISEAVFAWRLPPRQKKHAKMHFTNIASHNTGNIKVTLQWISYSENQQDREIPRGLRGSVHISEALLAGGITSGKSFNSITCWRREGDCDYYTKGTKLVIVKQPCSNCHAANNRNISLNYSTVVTPAACSGA